MPRLALVLCLATAAGGLPLRAQVSAHPRVREAAALLERWLDAERAYKRIPGLSAAVVHDQEVVWSGGSGYADLAARRPATPATIYSICSISKLFTSVALMQLRDQGKVRLDDPVARHLPWFAIKRTNPESGEITLEGLLTHASGLPRESAHPYWSPPDYRFPSRDQIIASLPGQETLYPAETFFQYSNLGITLAGEVVAAGSGRPFADYVRAAILEPLGMTSTTPDMPEAERGRRLATGYGPWAREGERASLPFFRVEGIAPAAGFASSAEDLARFASWQFRLLRKGGTEILAANTLREMHRVHWVDPEFETTWGLGFVVWRDAQKTFVGHDGACPGYRTSLLLRPPERIAAIAMTNAIDANANELTQRAYDIVAPAIKAATADSGPQPKPADPALERYLGAYESGWRGETLVLLWEGGLASVGLPAANPVAGITKLRKTGDHTFRRVRRDGDLAEVWTFELGPDGRADRLRINYNVSRRVR
jgi:CubicO group peptidase (beta-lactamase class C family)